MEQPQNQIKLPLVAMEEYLKTLGVTEEEVIAFCVALQPFAQLIEAAAPLVNAAKKLKEQKESLMAAELNRVTQNTTFEQCFSPKPGEGSGFPDVDS